MTEESPTFLISTATKVNTSVCPFVYTGADSEYSITRIPFSLKYIFNPVTVGYSMVPGLMVREAPVL